MLTEFSIKKWTLFQRNTSMEAARFRQIYQDEANQGGLRSGGRAQNYGGCEGGRTPAGMKCHCKTVRSGARKGQIDGSYQPRPSKANKVVDVYGDLTWAGYIQQVYRQNKPGDPELTLTEVMQNPSVKQGWADYKYQKGIVPQIQSLPKPRKQGSGRKQPSRKLIL